MEETSLNRLSNKLSTCAGLRAVAQTLAVAVVVSMAGCSQAPELAQVEGQVTYNGQPLKFGTVMFQSVKGGQPASGVIQADGSFKLVTPKAGDGAKQGSYEISVFCYDSQDPAKRAIAATGDMSLGKFLLPKKYMLASTSGLTAEVKPAGNEPIVLELTDK